MHFKNLAERLRQSLVEDGSFSDRTTARLGKMAAERVRAAVVAKSPGVFCGAFLLKPLFGQLDPRVRAISLKKDGARVRKGDEVAAFFSSARAALGGERVFLNLASRLSGIATLTAAYAKAVQGRPAKIFDTRKTTPLWRDLEKYAVRCGGGFNHRLSLHDAILVKDNHWAILDAKKVSAASLFGPGQVSRRGLRFVEMEATNDREIWQAIRARVDIILLDNMRDADLKGAIQFISAARRALGFKTPQIEVSGNVTVERARVLSRLGVDRISVGALTHSAPALDLSMEVQ